MPAVTRVGLDKHVGHASPTPNPYHQTSLSYILLNFKNV